jgi:hypothetical protein
VIRSLCCSCLVRRSIFNQSFEFMRIRLTWEQLFIRFCFIEFDLWRTHIQTGAYQSYETFEQGRIRINIVSNGRDANTSRLFRTVHITLNELHFIPRVTVPLYPHRFHLDTSRKPPNDENDRRQGYARRRERERNNPYSFQILNKK